MKYEIQGKIISFEEVDKTSNAGKPYKKRTTLIDNGEEKNNIIPFGCSDKVAEYLKTVPIGSTGTFTFVISPNHYNDNWYTSLYMVEANISATATMEQSNERAVRGDLQEPISYNDTDSLPF